MTVLSSKKPSNNTRDASNTQPLPPGTSTASATLTRPRLSRDDEHILNTATTENSIENNTSIASSPSITTTTTTTISNEFLSTEGTSANSCTHSKRKSHYTYHHRPQTINKQPRRRRKDLPSSSNSESSNDETTNDQQPRSVNISSCVHSKHVDTTDQCNSEDEYESSATKYNQNHLSEEEITFARTLKEKKGLIIKPVKEDGACLFRSVADQVFGDEEMHGAVRQHCMDYIVKNADFFRAYITEDFDHYVSRKRRANCHGNHIEMIALSEIYNRPIEVYEYSLEPINTVHGMYKTDNEPIRLSYHCSIHYNSVVDPWRPTAGHGLGLPDLQPGHAQESLIVDALRESEESHIDRTLLNDQLAATDWEATQEELIKQIARESYLEWLCEGNPPVTKEKTSLPSASSSTTTTSDEPLKTQLPLKLDEQTDGQFALPFNYDGEPDDDDSLMQQILEMSQMEYFETLKKQSSTTEDTIQSSTSDSHLL